MEQKTIKEFLNTNVFKEIFDSLNIGIHMIDSKGNTIFYNKICEEIEGNSKEWIIGKNMNDLVQEGIYSESIAIEVLDKKKQISKSQTVNGKYIYTTGVPIFLDEKLYMVVMNIVDMTKIEELRFKYNELKDINKKIKNELNILNKLELKDNLIISKSQQMKKILMLALRAAKVDSNILIEGESGVGKGVLSSYIHNNSERKNGPFVKVDCSTLSETLIESELFGYESGSFTGARREGKAGLIQMADKGTLFLDEIGELPLKLQVKILGVIQDKVFQKVGGNKKIKTDIRIIAATNRDLFNMVENGTFREDLYYRLKVIKVKIPSLRERKDDIIPLIDYFIKKYNKKYNFNKSISVKTKKILLNYKWPGNIRELENEIERLVVLSENDLIVENDIFTGDIDKSNCMPLSNNITFKENVYEYEKKLLKTYMKQSKDIHELSLYTGLEESTIRKKAKRLNIEIRYR